MLFVAQSSDDIQNLRENGLLERLLYAFFYYMQLADVKMKLTDSYFSSSSVTCLVASCFRTKTVNKSTKTYLSKQRCYL